MTMAKKTAKKTAAKHLKITLVRSTIGFNRTQAETVRGLGLRRLHHSVELLDTPETRGMIHKVQHLVTVE
jgi:large subunit ribosomal protein L30